MDRMSPLDASFLHIEDSDRTVGMHIGSTAVFAGPAPDEATFMAAVEARLPLVPRYRQRVETVPLGIGRPVWVDDANFALDYHVRRTALPSPGGDRELRRLVARLMSQRLDRTKPLWEMWVVEGLADGQWALVSKVHHCMVDGISGVELLAVLMDLSPDATTPVAVPDWLPERPPSRVGLALRTVGDLTTNQYEQLRVVTSMVRRPRRLLEPAGEVVAGLRSLAGIARPTPSALTGVIGPHRAVAWAETDLDSIKQIRSTLGGTVNDVVLAAITHGFRALLLARGEDLTGRTVRTLVPVSVRATRSDGAAAHDGTFDNKISAMFAELPVSLAGPVEMLDAIRRQLGDLKRSKQAVAGEALTSLSGFAPPVLLGLGMRVAARVLPHTGNVHTVTTNVPGPQLPLYSCGRLLVRAYPYVPIVAPLRTGVAIFSYNGSVTFGITGDRDVSADIGALADGITAAVDGLLEAAGVPHE